jgi:hypothetical protein
MLKTACEVLLFFLESNCRRVQFLLLYYQELMLRLKTLNFLSEAPSDNKTNSYETENIDRCAAFGPVFRI